MYLLNHYRRLQNFLGGGKGASPKKVTQKGEKKCPPHGDKAPIRRKKTLPTQRKNPHKEKKTVSYRD